MHITTYVATHHSIVVLFLIKFSHCSRKVRGRMKFLFNLYNDFVYIWRMVNYRVIYVEQSTVHALLCINGTCFRICKTVPIIQHCGKLPAMLVNLICLLILIFLNMVSTCLMVPCHNINFGGDKIRYLQK